jgi:hypothetical protein
MSEHQCKYEPVNVNVDSEGKATESHTVGNLLSCNGREAWDEFSAMEKRLGRTIPLWGSKAGVIDFETGEVK